MRVMIADDHPMVRLGLQSVIDNQPDLVHCGSASRGDTAIAMALEMHPDVVIMDVSMPGCDGIAATREILAVHPDIRVIVLTWHTGPDSRQAALAAGARAFLLKDVDAVDLLAQVRSDAAPAGAFAP